jgi:phospholipase/carboxylesterase
MLFGPRDATELDIVVGVVTTSHAWASGEPA